MMKNTMRPSREVSCGHEGRHLARSGASSGVGVWCPACQRWVTQALGYHPGWALPSTHALLNGVDRATLPVVNAHVERCEICQKDTSTPELHHWCPQALYRDNAPPNGGPTAWLCPACHAEWHAVVTPLLLGGMSEEGCKLFLRGVYRRGGRAGWARFVKVVLSAEEARKAHEARTLPLLDGAA